MRFYWNRGIDKIQCLRVQLTSGREKNRMDFEREHYQAYLNGRSIILAHELRVPKLFQGGNCILEVSLCIRIRNCTYSSMMTLLEKETI